MRKMALLLLSFAVHLLLCSAQPRETGNGLAAWLQGLGGFVSDKVQVRSDQQRGRGIFVTSNVDEGEILVTVPVEAMLLGERATNVTPCAGRIRVFFDQRLGQSHQPDGERTHAVFSMMTLLLSLYDGQKDRSAKWPHLDDLLIHWERRQQQRFPLLWPKRALREIEGTTASSVFSIATQGVVREYMEVLQQTCPEMVRKFSLQTYKKVWALVNSRVLTYPGSQVAKPQAALVPLFDLVNHHLPEPKQPLLSLSELQSHLSKSLGRFGTTDGSSGALHLWLREPSREVEVTDVYGLQSNEEMLWTSGFTVPWIHNLTCLTRTRVIIRPEDLPQVSLARPGFGSIPAADLLTRLGPFLNFNVGGCSEMRATTADRLGPVIAFLHAWMASTRAPSPSDLEAACGLTVPAPLQPLLQPFAKKARSVTAGWSFDRCKYLRLEDEALALDFFLQVIDEKVSQIPGGSLEEEEGLLQRKLGLWRDVATIRRDEKFLLRELTAWLSQERRHIDPKVAKGMSGYFAPILAVYVASLHRRLQGGPRWAEAAEL